MLLGRTVSFGAETVNYKAIDIYAQVEPHVAMENGVGDARLHLGANDIPGLVSENDSPFMLHNQLHLSLHFACRAL